MIDLPANAEHDPRPLTVTGLVRIVVAAATVVAVQASLLDTITTPVLRHVDLPLALASVLVLARPTHSVTVGLVFGLMVDASAHRLFGLHTVAYASLGPLADVLPAPALRWPSLVVWWRAAAGGLAVATIVAVGGAIASGVVAMSVLGSLIQVAAMTGLLAVPLSWATGLDAPFGRRRIGRHRGPIGLGPRPRLGPVRPLGT